MYKEHIEFALKRYLPVCATRKQKADLIRKYRRMYFNEKKKIPIYSEQFINKLGLFDGNMRAIGGNWFKDDNVGKCYHVVRDADGVFSVDETRYASTSAIRVRKIYKPKKPRVTKKPYEQTHVTIKCLDCGTEREIKTCDAFQVKRCKECQRKFKNDKRKRQIQEERIRKRELRDKLQKERELRDGYQRPSNEGKE